jgi:hypothetical protein
MVSELICSMIAASCTHLSVTVGYVRRLAICVRARLLIEIIMPE